MVVALALAIPVAASSCIVVLRPVLYVGQVLLRHSELLFTDTVRFFPFTIFEHFGPEISE
jgi:hypothetical protein